MIQTLDLDLLLVQLPFELLRMRASAPGESYALRTYSWLGYLISVNLPSNHKVVLSLIPDQILARTPQWTSALQT